MCLGFHDPLRIREKDRNIEKGRQTEKRNREMRKEREKKLRKLIRPSVQMTKQLCTRPFRI